MSFLLFLVASILISLAIGEINPIVDNALLFTTFHVFQQQVAWNTYGYNHSAYSEYGSGLLGPFNRPCSIANSLNFGKLFIVDSISTTNSSSISLLIYDQVESTKPSIILLATIDIPKVIGGSDAKCHMATLGKFVYIGTDQSTLFSQVNWETLIHVEKSNYVPASEVTSSITVSNSVVSVSQTSTYQYFNLEGATQSIGGTPRIVLSSEGHFLE